MAKVSAVIMIYDIRGFTSASKKLPTADLGAFADAAHRAILGQFNARRADFIKNLGDGHLMIWETTAEPETALVKFVVDASAAARKAFPAFVAEHLAAQGIAGLVFPTRIGFGVATGAGPLLTVMATRLPAVTPAPAAGFCLMISPTATVLLAAEETVPSERAAAASVSAASAAVFPLSAGTSMSPETVQVARVLVCSIKVPSPTAYVLCNIHL